MRGEGKIKIEDLGGYEKLKLPVFWISRIVVPVEEQCKHSCVSGSGIWAGLGLITPYLLKVYCNPFFTGCITEDGIRHSDDAKWAPDNCTICECTQGQVYCKATNCEGKENEECNNQKWLDVIDTNYII